MSSTEEAKIVELEDDQYLSDDEPTSDFECEDNEYPMKFKQSVLKNKRFLI